MNKVQFMIIINIIIIVGVGTVEDEEHTVEMNTDGANSTSSCKYVLRSLQIISHMEER